MQPITIKATCTHSSTRKQPALRVRIPIRSSRLALFQKRILAINPMMPNPR
jgi:hypothetical protein